MYLNPIQVVLLFAFCVLIGSLLWPHLFDDRHRKENERPRENGSAPSLGHHADSFRPLLLPLARGLSRCLTKPLTQWNGN